MSVITLLAGSLGLYLLWYRRGRDAPVGELAPYYAAPPEDVPPGVVGVLLDERADMQDITATLVDLARRGYLQIVEEQSGTFIKSSDFLFVRGTGDLRALRPHEKRLFDRLFGANQTERRLSSLKNAFYKEIPALKKDLYEEAARVGYFDRNPASTRNTYTVVAVLGLLAAVGLSCGLMAVFGEYTPLVVLVGIALGILAVGFLILSRYMSRKTPAGAAAAAKWQGFKRYLENVDRYTQVDAAKDQFDRYLPYAIAFGIERSWVRRFEAVNTPAPTWYYPYGYYPSYGYGHHHHHSSSSGQPSSGDNGGGSGGGMPSLDQAAGGSFAGLNAMSSGFFTMLNSTASTFTSVPQSSGGSSGGWSGGGGGGGGGSGGGSSGFG